MNWSKFSKEVHNNAVEHGWWETERKFYEVIALIQSELSEALEEDRAGHGKEWYAEGSDKPEGIAVEFADAIIRILDWFGKFDADPTDMMMLAEEDFRKEIPDGVARSVSWTVAEANYWISASYNCWMMARPSLSYNERLAKAVMVILKWAVENKIDMDAVLQRKHEYNKTRPYKHGKRF